MTPDQRSQLLALAANMAGLLHSEGHSRACTEIALQAVISCLFGIIWQIPPDNPGETDSDFAGAVIYIVLDKFYGKAKEEVKAHVVC